MVDFLRLKPNCRSNFSRLSASQFDARDLIGHDEHPCITGKSLSEGVAGDKVLNDR